MSSKMTSKPITKCGVISCDPGNEIDDELLINWAINNMDNYLIYIMCVPGCESTNPTDSENIINKRMQHLVNLFPMFSYNNKINKYQFNTDSCTFIICGPEILHELTSIPGPNYYTLYETDRTYIDLYIDIAPSWHINPNLYLQLEIGHRIVMGDLNNPHKSINLTKAIPPDCSELLSEYIQQEKNIVSNKTTVISTNFARTVPIPHNHLNNLPPSLNTPLKNKAFEQFVGRPPAHLVWALDISIANLNTISNMFNKHDSTYLDIMINAGKNTFNDSVRDNVKHQVQVFLQNAPTNIPKLAFNLYSDRLYKIALFVMFITKCYYSAPDFTLDNLNDPIKARVNWELFIDEFKCEGTPAYDLLAAVAIINPNAIGDLRLCKKIINEM